MTFFLNPNIKNCFLTLRRGKGKMAMVRAKIKDYALSQDIGCPIPTEAKY
jgi:hypothetical protein